MKTRSQRKQNNDEYSIQVTPALTLDTLTNVDRMLSEKCEGSPIKSLCFDESTMTKRFYLEPRPTTSSSKPTIIQNTFESEDHNKKYNIDSPLRPHRFSYSFHATPTEDIPFTPKSPKCHFECSLHSPFSSMPITINPFSPLPKEYIGCIFTEKNIKSSKYYAEPIRFTTPPRCGKRKSPTHASSDSSDSIMSSPNSSRHPTFYTSHIHRRKSPLYSPRHFSSNNNKSTACDHTTHGHMDSKPSLSQSRFATDFQVIEQIGEGSFGTVYKVLSRLDGCLYAVKTSKSTVRGDVVRSELLREVHALASLCNFCEVGSLYVLRYHQAWIEDSLLFIQTELCELSLRKEVEIQKSVDRHNCIFPEEKIFKVLRDISLALEFMHRHDMVHLDIKPDNIFLKDGKYKLADFGLASKRCGIAADEGDSRYLSTEMLTNDPEIDLTKCDVFSLGATAYELYLGKILPSCGVEWHDIRAGTLSPSLSSSNLHWIISTMLQEVPGKRPSAAIVLQSISV